MTNNNSEFEIKKITCPQCGGEVVPIIYGLPTEKAFEDPKFYSGGCIITDEQPNWACTHCEIEFE